MRTRHKFRLSKEPDPKEASLFPELLHERSSRYPSAFPARASSICRSNLARPVPVADHHGILNTAPYKLPYRQEERSTQTLRFVSLLQFPLKQARGFYFFR